MSAHTQPTPLIVALVANGDLHLWHESTGETAQFATNDAVQPYLAPDGARVAFTAGADDLPLALWVVGGDDEPRQVVAPALLEGSLIDQVAWLDGSTLYFNTSVPQPPFGVMPQNDLWRVDVASGDVTNLLPAGKGGAFAISPDGQHIAVVSAGALDDAGQPATAGEIRVIDPLATSTATLHTFAPMTFGGHHARYPAVQWLPDSSALHTAIYHSNGDVSLLRVPVRGEVAQLRTLALDGGWVNGWSADGQYLGYVVAAEAGTRYIIADADGANPRTITAQPVRWAGWAWRGHHYYTIASDSFTEVTVHAPEQDTPLTFNVETIDALRYVSLFDANTFLYGDVNGVVMGMVRFSDEVAHVEIFRTTAPEMRPLRYDAVAAP